MLKAGRVVKALRVVRLTKLVRFMKLAVFIEKLEENFSINRNLLQLVKLLLGTVVMCHFFACMWYFFGSLDDAPGGWVYEQGVQNADTSTKYLTSFYWAVATLATVGACKRLFPPCPVALPGLVCSASRSSVRPCGVGCCLQVTVMWCRSPTVSAPSPSSACCLAVATSATSSPPWRHWWPSWTRPRQRTTTRCGALRRGAKLRWASIT